MRKQIRNLFNSWKRSKWTWKLTAAPALHTGGNVCHAITLIISGRPRVPIVCAERIVVSKPQVQHFPVSRGKGAVRINQIIHTLLPLGFLPETMKVEKSFYVCPFPSLCSFGTETTSISIYFGLQSRANSDRQNSRHPLKAAWLLTFACALILVSLLDFHKAHLLNLSINSITINNDHDIWVFFVCCCCSCNTQPRRILICPFSLSISLKFYFFSSFLAEL